MKIGLEIEYFVEDSNGNIVLPNKAGLDRNQCDECGWLAEARSLPFEDSWHTIRDLEKAVTKLQFKLRTGYRFSIKSTVKLPHKLLWSAIRRFGKHSAEDECIYGLVKERRYQTAGLHIHFSQEHGILNIPRIIKFFDRHFKDQIIKEKRQLGCYEMKPWGFEYRSLPNSISIEDLEFGLVAFRNKIDKYEED